MAERNHVRTIRLPGLLAAAVIVAAAGILAGDAAAQDWTQWRGPMRDGTVTAFDAPATWPEGLTRQWSREVGFGYATPLLLGERLYLFTREGDDEVMQALDAATGETLWRTAYDAAFEMNPATNPHGPGPKSTPAYADGRLFTLGITGIVSAFDAETGERLWQVPAGPVEPLYHTAMSPLVVGELVIFHVGGHNAGALTAYDAATGAVRWALEGDGPAYGSPQLFEFGGTRQVVVLTQTRHVGVSVETGALLWERPFTTPFDTTSQTPLRHGDLLIETGMEKGITGFRVAAAGDGWGTEDVWHTDEVTLHMTNGVIADGVLVGLSHRNSGQYFGLDLDTGEVLWTSPPRQAENAAILRSGDTILSLQDDAQLVVLGNGRTEFDPVARYDVADSPTWTQPTLVGNRLYVKDVDTLTLWTVE
jgi:outer membrane protein assembly factor BamB